MSARETAIAGLVSVLSAALAPVTVTRDETRTRTPPPEGMVLVNEGDARDITPVVSPISFIVAHDAELVVVMPHTTTIPAVRADLDALLVDIVTALAGNRTLGGAVDWLDLNPPRFEASEDEGAGALMAASMPVTLHFTAPDSPAG
jgi:hypothetical protein